jgi:hypothetical protein
MRLWVAFCFGSVAFCLGFGADVRSHRCARRRAFWNAHRHRGEAGATFRGGIRIHAGARIQHGGTGRCAQVGGCASGAGIFRLFSSRPGRGFRDAARHEGARPHPGLAPAESQMADGRKLHFRPSSPKFLRTTSRRWWDITGAKIFAWDVVNEAFDELHPGELRSTIWRDQPGITPVRAPSFELRATLPARSSQFEARSKPTRILSSCFRWAHEADPQALLFYNEAEAEAVNPKSDAIYAMVRDFRERGVPIDGVGLQMHIANLHADVASISANIKRFTDLERRCTSPRWTLPCP